MPSPVVEVSLLVLGGFAAAWILTYLLHSTLLLAAAALATRAVPLAAVDRVSVWRFVMIAPFVTAFLHASGMPLFLWTWDLSRLAPQALVDWRAGVVSLLPLLLLPGIVLSGWATGRAVMRRTFGRRRPAPPDLQAELASLAIVLGCRMPTLTLSETAPVPAAVGFQEICVPAALMTSMPADERRALLAHEIGHLVRRDPLWSAVLGNLARMAAFQPLNRWAMRELRQACEEAADDFAVRATGDPCVLARALTSLTSILLLVPGSAAATGSPVVQRVAHLLDDGRRPARSRRRASRLAAAATVAVAMTVAAPGVSANPDRMTARLSWLTPSRDEPNARMREVRRTTREWRDAVRRVFR